MRNSIIGVLCILLFFAQSNVFYGMENSNLDLSSEETIRRVQVALNDIGYDCGTPDGVLGEITEREISAYKKENGIGEDGVITRELLEFLGIDNESSLSEDNVIEEQDERIGLSSNPIIVEDDTYWGTTTVEFGSYEQDGNEENGKEPIRWFIFKMDGNKAFLLSICALDVHVYHHENTDVTWADSDIRKWLNNEFYDTAFTDMQKKYILSTTIDNSNRDGWGIGGGPDTEDKVFLISYSESRELSENGRIRAPLTEYAIMKGAYNSYPDEGYGRWFLRSPGYSRSNICVAQTSYGIREAAGLNYDGGSVRPAIWIDASELNLEKQNSDSLNQSNDEAYSSDVSSIKDGNSTGGFSVWIPTNGGTKYHSYEGCSNMYNPILVTKEEAVNMGYSQCGKCW